MTVACMIKRDRIFRDLVRMESKVFAMQFEVCRNQLSIDPARINQPNNFRIEMYGMRGGSTTDFIKPCNAFIKAFHSLTFILT